MGASQNRSSTFALNLVIKESLLFLVQIMSFGRKCLSVTIFFFCRSYPVVPTESLWIAFL